MFYHLDDNQIGFPVQSYANEEGILAIGGKLNFEWLTFAYSNGIFPWFNPKDPIIWWCPDPRFVLFPEDLKISKSMRQILKKKAFKVTYNKAFEQVIENCKTVHRPSQEGDSWITDEMRKSYIELHKKNWAMSVEVWEEDELVGGLYGIVIGSVFCGESMFALKSNSSKFGFMTFVNDFKNQFKIIDCQYHTKHLESLGATHISRDKFLSYLPGYDES